MQLPFRKQTKTKLSKYNHEGVNKTNKNHQTFRFASLLITSPHNQQTTMNPCTLLPLFLLFSTIKIKKNHSRALVFTLASRRNIPDTLRCYCSVSPTLTNTLTRRNNKNNNDRSHALFRPRSQFRPLSLSLPLHACTHASIRSISAAAAV